MHLPLPATPQRDADAILLKVVEEAVAVQTVAALGVVAVLRPPLTQMAQRLQKPQTNGTLLQHNRPPRPLEAGTLFLQMVTLPPRRATGPMNQARML